MRVVITINLDNADVDAAAILRECAEVLDCGIGPVPFGINLRDTNGNAVGYMETVDAN